MVSSEDGRPDQAIKSVGLTKQGGSLSRWDGMPPDRDVTKASTDFWSRHLGESTSRSGRCCLTLHCVTEVSGVRLNLSREVRRRSISNKGGLHEAVLP